MIRIIFFDFDLTLVNSMPGVKASYLALCRITGEKPSKNGFKKYCGPKVSKNIEHFYRISGLSKKQLIETFHKAYISKIPEMRFYAKDLLPKLKQRKIKIVIITNNDDIATKAVCRHFKIKYNLLITDDEMKKYEAKHDMMHKLLGKFRIHKSEALYVGDQIIDVREAHKTGIRSVIVPRGLFHRAYILSYHPDFMLSNLNKIIKII